LTLTCAAGSIPDTTMRKTRVTLLACLLAALMYAAGQAFSGIPNVEVITFLAFLSGYLLGARAGAVAGGAGMAAHSLLNSMGAVAPPVWIAQVACYALIGASGARIGPWIARPEARIGPALGAAAAGAVLALAYQVVVNLVSFFTFARNASLWTYVWGGVAFAAIQVVWNAALFFAAAPPTTRVLARLRRELSGGGARA
jgi:hypothetical protein